MYFSHPPQTKSDTPQSHPPLTESDTRQSRQALSSLEGGNIA